MALRAVGGSPSPAHWEDEPRSGLAQFHVALPGGNTASPVSSSLSTLLALHDACSWAHGSGICSDTERRGSLVRTTFTGRRHSQVEARHAGS